jgi:hypothetical protein
MRERVGKLGPAGRLEVRQQVKLAAVIRAVAASAERHHAIGLVAAAERARHQVRRVDRPAAAHKAPLAGHLGPLLLRGRADRAAPERGAAPEPRPAP